MVTRVNRRAAQRVATHRAVFPRRRIENYLRLDLVAQFSRAQTAGRKARLIVTLSMTLHLTKWKSSKGEIENEGPD
jgi:hypothetical protein